MNSKKKSLKEVFLTKEAISYSDGSMEAEEGDYVDEAAIHVWLFIAKAYDAIQDSDLNAPRVQAHLDKALRALEKKTGVTIDDVQGSRATIVKN